jgi:predicted transcriptional regulator
MTMVTLDVRSLEETLADVAASMESCRVSEPRFSFATPQLLFRLLSGRRWDLLRAMAGAGPLSLREAARRVGRDVKSVHGDVHALLDVGLLQKTVDGRIVFPFDAVHVDFVLKAA